MARSLQIDMQVGKTMLAIVLKEFMSEASSRTREPQRLPQVRKIAELFSWQG